MPCFKIITVFFKRNPFCKFKYILNPSEMSFNKMTELRSDMDQVFFDKW
jgi:hypothetical protein